MRAVISDFERIERWDVKFFTQPHYQWRFSRIEKFADVATRRVEPVSPADLDGTPLASIHFDGSTTPRATDAADIKGRLFRAHPGDLVYSKIDARNGAISVIPDELGIVAFSAEYPVYEFSTKGLLLAKFVRLLCRTRAFRMKVNALAVGHSGRKRVSPEQMDKLEVPVPTEAEQLRIVAAAEELTRSVAAARARADRIEVDLSNYVLRELGISPQPFSRYALPFIAQARELDRWSVFRGMMRVQGVTESIASSYPVRLLGDPKLSAVSYGIQKCPQNRPGKFPRPYLRVANVQAVAVDVSEIKYIDVPDDQLGTFSLEDGDLLLCEGNSEELVGRPAIWRGEIPNCVHQNHILKVRLNREQLNPEFVLAYMNTQPARLYFLGRAKRTTNLASINSLDVKEMPIPVPPMPVQVEIIEAVNGFRRLIAGSLEAATRMQSKADDEIEELLIAYASAA